VLSGGEKARLALARMLVHPAALLLLDEPTNHLDLASREVLEEALAAFAARSSSSRTTATSSPAATRVIEIAGGRLTSYLGGFDDYVDARRRRRRRPLPPRRAGAASRARPGPPGRTRAPALRRRVEEIEARISGLEARLAAIGEALGDPALYADGTRARAMALEPGARRRRSRPCSASGSRWRAKLAGRE